MSRTKTKIEHLLDRIGCHNILIYDELTEYISVWSIEDGSGQTATLIVNNMENTAIISHSEDGGTIIQSFSRKH